MFFHPQDFLLYQIFHVTVMSWFQILSIFQSMKEINLNLNKHTAKQRLEYATLGAFIAYIDQV